jgi:predicted RNA-binding protein with TRAM domain
LAQRGQDDGAIPARGFVVAVLGSHEGQHPPG